MIKRSLHPAQPVVPGCAPKPAAMLAFAIVALTFGGCQDRAAVTAKRAAYVRTELVKVRERYPSVTLSGEVQARFRTDLAFRVGGRVASRYVDVGAHVEAGQVLARLDPTEQQADLHSATAAVAAAESQLRVAQATFARQNSLLASGFTTRTSYDQALEGFQTAQAALEAAKAQLGTAKDAFGYTELRRSPNGTGLSNARNYNGSDKSLPRPANVCSVTAGSENKWMGT